MRIVLALSLLFLLGACSAHNEQDLHVGPSGQHHAAPVGYGPPQMSPAMYGYGHGPVSHPSGYPAGPSMAIPSAPPPEPEQTKWGSGKELFQVSGTPEGFTLDGVRDPAKAAQCKSPRHLVRTDQCRQVETGQIECKLDCQ